MFHCVNCGSPDAIKRIDWADEPFLCDECYALEIYGECDCDRCNHSYYLGDRLHCPLEHCNPSYDI